MLSLKSFHLFFIAVSMFLSAGIGYWGVRQFQNGQGSEFLTLGLFGILGLLALALYLFSVVTKYKELK